MLAKHRIGATLASISSILSVVAVTGLLIWFVGSGGFSTGLFRADVPWLVASDWLFAIAATNTLLSAFVWWRIDRKRGRFGTVLSGVVAVATTFAPCSFSAG